MRVEIASVSEFFERVRPAYQALVQAPPNEPAALEIVLAAGEYRGANLSVGDSLDRRAIDLSVRGAEASRPPLLIDSMLSLTGDQVRLENVILRSRVDRLPTLRVVAGRSLAIDGCAF